jgi:anti-anti-sigma factor
VAGEPAFRIEPLELPRSYRLIGSLDVPSAGGLSELFDELCRSAGDVTLDVSAVTFMDSGALRAIIQTCFGLGGSGVVRIVNPTGQVRRLFELAGVERQMPNLVVVEE